MNAQTPIPAEDLTAISVARTRRRWRRVLMIGALVIVAIGALWFYLTGGRSESTDNASLQAGMVAVSPSIAGKVVQLQVGNYVQPGRAVFTLTASRFWVQANFKENQLHYMRIGQPATILVDAFPDRALRGHVESFSPGTGSSFAILPAENATGNWVKVVQRLPVQIALDETPADLPLSAGLSVDVSVDTGHRRHLFSADTPASSPRRPMRLQTHVPQSSAR